MGTKIKFKGFTQDIVVDIKSEIEHKEFGELATSLGLLWYSGDPPLRVEFNSVNHCIRIEYTDLTLTRCSRSWYESLEYTIITLEEFKILINPTVKDLAKNAIEKMFSIE